MPDPDFTTEHVSGEYWLMRQYGDWLPMRKTRTGNLAFLTGPGYKADGTRERALEIIYQHQREDKEYEESHPRDAARLKRMGRSRHERNPETRSDVQVLPGGWRLYQKDSGFWFASHSGFEHGPFTSERSASQHIANLQRENPGKLTFGQSPFDQVPGERKRYHVTDDRGFIVAKFDHGYIAAEEAQDMSEKHSGVTYSVVDTRNGQVHDRFRDGQELKGNPGKGWFTRCMEGVSASGSAYDPGAVCGAELKKMGYSRRNPAEKGDWVTFKFVDLHGVLRSVTGKVTDVSPDGYLTFRSDGGQRGYPRGKKVRVRWSEVELSSSPHAPHQRRNPKVPGIAGWSKHAGGTFAAAGKYGYTYNAEGGHLQGSLGSYRTYSIDPISNRLGRHMGYKLSVAGSPDYSGLHHDLGMFRSPQSAASAARKDYSASVRHQLNPRAPQSKISQFGARQILAQVAGNLDTDFHSLSSSQVSDLLEEADKVGYRKSKSAPGSRGRMFYQYLQRTAGRLESRRNADGKGTRMGGRSRRTRTNPTKRYQIRAAGRIFTVSAKTKAAAQAEVAKYCRQHGLVVRNPKHIRPSDFSYLWTASQKNELTRLADDARITLSLAVEKAGTDFKKLRTWLRKRAVGYRPVRRRNRKKSVSMLVPRSGRRTIKSVERRTTQALRRYLGGSR